VAGKSYLVGIVLVRERLGLRRVQRR